MATKRMISRRITESDKMLALNGDDRARFVYVALLAHTDREGRVQANPKGLKFTIFEAFEYTVEDIAHSLQALSDAGLIALYKSQRHQLIAQFTKFEEFNKPHPKESASDLPRHGDKGTQKVSDVASATGVALPGKDAGRGSPDSLNQPSPVNGKELSGGKNSTEFSTGPDGEAPEGATPPGEVSPEVIERIRDKCAKLPDSIRRNQEDGFIRAARDRAQAQAWTEARGLPPISDRKSAADYEIPKRAQAWRRARAN